MVKRPFTNSYPDLSTNVEEELEKYKVCFLRLYSDQVPRHDCKGMSLAEHCWWPKQGKNVSQCFKCGYYLLQAMIYAENVNLSKNEKNKM